MRYYILNSQNLPERVYDVLEWAQWLENSPNRQLANDTIGNVVVSTVFTGLDICLIEGIRPLLWESMVFGGLHDGYQCRYTSSEEALHGHELLVKLERSSGVFTPPDEISSPEPELSSEDWLYENRES